MSGNTLGGLGSGQGNIVAFNKGNAGVLVENGAHDLIVGNSIYSNDNLGIARVRGGASTPNDHPDADGTPNFPVITSVAGNVISGTLDGAASTTYTIELFTDTACDTAGGYGEGQTFLGRLTAVTDSIGAANFNFTSSTAIASVVTATASTATDTSEFSACFTMPATGAGTGGSTSRTGSTSTGTTTAASPTDGSGSMTLDVMGVTAGSSGNTLHFTYTAGAGGLSGGVVQLTIRPGGAPPRRPRPIPAT